MERRRVLNDKPIVVVGNDVDLLVLLVGLTPHDLNLHFYTIVSTSKKEKKLYSTRDNRHFTPFILFAHAFVGCDTTSAFYNKGKKTIISLLQKDEILCQSTSVFYAASKTLDELYEIGERIMKHLYATDKEMSLSVNELRYKKFTSAVAGVKKDILCSLPPTRTALFEHIKRVYYQVQQWMGNKLDPLQWGWERLRGENTILIPTKTSLPAAPDELLRKVSCNCASTNCSTSRCVCKKAGLHCTPLCKKYSDKDECSSLPATVSNQTEEDIDWESSGGEEEEEEGDGEERDVDEGDEDNEYDKSDPYEFET